MAHFAKLDQNNVVLEVHAVANEALDPSDQETSGIAFLTNLLGHSNWKQTSYNNSFRYNYAAIGDSYNAQADAFIAPDPLCHNERSLNSNTYRWTCENADHIKKF